MSALHKRFARKTVHLARREHQQSSTKENIQEEIFLDSTDQTQAVEYLALVNHSKGKESLSKNDGQLNDEIRFLLNKAIGYYERNLILSKELNDKVAEGRTLGNIGNVNYLLQDYSASVEYLEKRLTVAKELNDQAGQRRAHGNLGNAYLYLEDFDKSLQHYREAMSLGELMNDESFIARMNYTIGRVYSLKQDYDTSIYFHEKHLQSARQLQDCLGQCRAYYTLSQLYEKVNQDEKAKKYDSLYKALSREIEEPIDDTISMSTSRSGASHHLLKNLRTDSISISLSEGGTTNIGSSASSSQSPHSARSNPSAHSSISDVRSFTGSHNQPSGEKSFSTTSKKSKTNSGSFKSNLMHHLGKRSPVVTRKEPLPSDPDELVDLVCRMQKSRFDDQRCDLKSSSETNAHRPSAQLEDIFKTVDRLQKSRLNDQRTNLPVSTSQSSGNEQVSQLNEQFFDQLAKCQNSRLDDQRAVLIPIQNHNSSSSSSRPTSATSIISESSMPTTDSSSEIDGSEIASKTLPDDDFFSLLNRLQSRRIDQQRTCLPSSSIVSPTSSVKSSSKRSRINQ